MTCVVDAPESYGCSDCLNTGRSGEYHTQLAEAEDRIFDLLLGDDAQAYKEAERYLARHRFDLYQRVIDS